MKVARYIIVLDRYDDDDFDGASVAGGHDGTEFGGCEQVARELNQAMESEGVPAGFFNVIAREVTDGYPNGYPIAEAASELIRPDVVAMLTRERRQV